MMSPMEMHMGHAMACLEHQNDSINIMHQVYQRAMFERKLIVVFGGTGAQGGSVARALLKDGRYRVRVLSRKPENPKLKEFKDKGAEVVYADQDDPNSLQMALVGAYGCFVITDSISALDGHHGETQGLNSVKAAKSCGLQHIVFSGLENCERLFSKELVFADSKGRVEDFMEENGYPFTSMRLPNYFENFTTYWLPEKIGENTFVLNIPLGEYPMAGLAVEDIGRCVLGIFNNRDKYLGKRIGVAGDKLTIPQYATVFQSVFPGSKFSHSTELAKGPSGKNQAVMWCEVEPKVDRSVDKGKELFPGVQSFETWLKNNKDQIKAFLK